MQKHIVELCCLTLEYILNCGYVINHLNAYFLLYIFLLMTLLAVYFICILDYGNDVRQKANSSNLFKFKMGCKAAETTHNTNNTFGPRTSHECTVQWWFKKFCKGDESLEDEECSVQPQKLTTTN